LRLCEASARLAYGVAYTDPVTGFKYLNNRYYDPSTGQFITQDPDVAQTGQPYEYAADNPRNNTDPTGLSANFSCVPGLRDYPGCTHIEGTPSISGVVNGLASVGSSVGGFVATVGSLASAVCTAGILLPVTDEGCLVIKGVTFVAGVVTASSDTYRAITGQGSAIAIPLDFVSLGLGSVGSSVDGLFDELVEDVDHNAESIFQAHAFGAGALGYGSATALSLVCVQGLS